LNQVIGIRNRSFIYERSCTFTRRLSFFYCRAGMDMWRNGGRMFVGHSNVTVVTNDPSSLNNTMGFCIDTTDVGRD
jgi:hypothetical protein